MQFALQSFHVQKLRRATKNSRDQCGARETNVKQQQRYVSFLSRTYRLPPAPNRLENPYYPETYIFHIQLSKLNQRKQFSNYL